MSDAQRLGRSLEELDGHGYKGYRQIQGRWRLDEAGTPFDLHVDHVQADPFAAPSRLRVRVSQSVAGFPAHTFVLASRRRALCSYLAMRFGEVADNHRQHVGSGSSGRIEIDRPGQQVLERTAVLVDADTVEVRFVVGLPAAGRRILGRAAADLLCHHVPAIVAASLRYAHCDASAIDAWTRTAEDAEALRRQLPDHNLVAFVADGAVLPRRSGVDDGPLEGAIPFRSPPSLRVELQTPNAGAIGGMGLPAGVSLIVGGGFHGKSTLLAALAHGVYDHRPGDGRERVVSDPTAVKVRAEDGRRTAGVDVSGFIGDLPDGGDTRFFCTDNASGSTSQAANIVEALEVGATALLVDEDTAATNFMIRDGRMQQLVAREHEPITPFVDRVRPLYEDHGVSTVLVMGGSGDYFGVADTVIAMEGYTPRDVTERAHAIATAHVDDRQVEVRDRLGDITPRVPLPSSIQDGRRGRGVRLRTRGTAQLLFGDETIDLAAVEQLVHASQTRAIAAALLHAREHHMDGERSLSIILDLVMGDIADHGLSVLAPHPVGDWAAFRRHELAAALNRLRTLEVRPLTRELAL